MSLLRPPFRALALDSRLALGEVRGRLSADLDPPGPAAFLGIAPVRGSRPFVGTLTATGVEMERRLPRRSSFVPVVRARFVEHASGTKLLVTMSLRWLTRIVLAVFFGLAALSTVGLVNTGRPMLAAGPVLFVLASLLAVVSFNHEANVVEAYLRQRLDA